MGKKLIVTITSELELWDGLYDEPLEDLTDEQIIETEKDEILEWFFDNIKLEDWRIIKTVD